MIDYFNDQTNFSYKLLQTDKKVSRICRTFINNSPSY